MKHALVVGGTGMLSGVSLWLMEKDYHVSVIARNPTRMQRLIDQASDSTAMTPLLVDYSDEEALRKKIKEAIQLNGSIQLVIAWIHSYAKNALQIITEEVANQQGEWSLFHILSSSSKLEDIRKNVKTPDNCSYHQVQLGFILEGNRSRWLTHSEISNGVIEAIEKNKDHQIVGIIEPWDKRP